MPKIVEAVPNFSEGRRPEIIKEITDTITSVAGVVLLDSEMDKDHNRAVVTVAGEPEPLKQGLFLGIKKASELIDLREHKGEHPRMGATDVCPFVPIQDVSTAEAIELAKQLGERVAAELEIPVYLYEEAAQRPERGSLPNIRNKWGQYEGIREKIASEEALVPDFGPRKLHDKAGAVAIGVRLPLIAFNAYLGTNNIKIARRIAKDVRSNSGGFQHCRALGFAIEERGCVQVSMNMVNYLDTPLYRVLETIKSEAVRWGTQVTSTEIVGLVPNDALIYAARWYLMLEGFHKEQVLEERLRKSLEQQGEQAGLKSFVDSVAASTPAPGGGSVSAAAGSLAGALSAMVCRLTMGKKKYEGVADRVSEILKECDSLRDELNDLVVKDAAAFDDVMAAMKMPRGEEALDQARVEAMQKATIRATEIPLSVMMKSLQALKLCKEIAEIGNVNSVSDAGVGALMAHAGVQGAWYNVKINLPGIEDKSTSDRIGADADKTLKKADELAKQAREIVVEKIG
jgi:glutamate formiminotransferase/formiminotetrahydrofolate cyclodeaminase